MAGPGGGAWWRKFISPGSASNPAPPKPTVSPDIAQDLLVAFEPFERIIEANDLEPRHVRRDLLLLVEQFVLPGMLYANHPHIHEILAPESVDGNGLIHCFSHAMHQGIARGLWTDSQIDDDTLFSGFHRYISAIKTQHVNVGDYAVSIVALPQPVSPPEGYFAFLCRKQHEVQPHLQRYYVSEMAQKGAPPFLCGRNTEGGHCNFGLLEESSLSCALNRVTELLKH